MSGGAETNTEDCFQITANQISTTDFTDTWSHFYHVLTRLAQQQSKEATDIKK